MGGNARATNKITGEETLAQKIPIKDIGRSVFIKKFIELFEEIDRRFQKMHGKPLWENKSILKNGLAFNGSTSFIMNPDIHDDEVIPYKSSSGDIDIMVPEQYKSEMWQLLDSFEAKPNIMKDVVYKGSNKLSISAIGEQINCVFEVKFGGIITQSQIDWELTKFEGSGENAVPSEYSRFGHSSSLSDAQNGFKGVAHKYILRALAGGASLRSDILIATPKATIDKPVFKKTKGTHITELRMQKFFVSKGLRKAYEPVIDPNTKQQWEYEGKKVYKEVPSNDSNYETSIKQMYKILFSDNVKHIQKMWSFVGIIDLMVEHLDKKSIDDTYERFIEILWGKGSQKLERDSPDLDFEIKANAVNYMIKKMPQLKKYDNQIKKMTKEFYENYHKMEMSESMLHGNNFRGLLEKLMRFKGFRKGTMIEFNGPFDKQINKHIVMQGEVLADTKGKEDVQVNTKNGKMIVKYEDVKGVL